MPSKAFEIAQIPMEILRMKRFLRPLSIALLAAPLVFALPFSASLLAQSFSLSQNLVAADPGEGSGGSQTILATRVAASPMPTGPFSRFAVGGGISPLGVNLTTVTNLDRYVNLRATGNVLKFTENGISTNGFTVNANLNLTSAGVSADVYPFPNHGLRFSPGVLLYNNNGANATFTVQGGTSFTLNGYDYYASSTNPVKGIGNLGLHSRNPAFTITTGWGNELPRNGKHWSFPMEVGVALVGAPSLNIALTSGQVCDAQGQNCVDVATDPDVHSNLQAQIAKYKNDLDPLKTYPIVSAGVSYNFHLRRAN
jgi:hypothetical protein